MLEKWAPESAEILQSDRWTCIQMGRVWRRQEMVLLLLRMANKKTALLNAGIGRLMTLHSFLVSKINMITCILKLMQTHC